MMLFRRRAWLFSLLALTLAACVSGSAARHRGQAMVAAADPRAAEAALQMLREGGTATDAAIAAEAVLGLVEPQSSGVGGGGFLLFYDGATHRIDAYDGRERAPAGATPDMFLDAAGHPLPFVDAQASGRSVGTPSLFAMLKLAHEQHGRLPWARLFEPAIQLAENGFEVSPRLARSIVIATAQGRLREDPAARAYFYDETGAPRPVGYLLKNPAYAETLRRIAAQGPSALSHGEIAEAIVAAARREPRAGTMTLEDLQSYAPRRREAVCGAYRTYRVCGAPLPSSGGEAVLAVLGLYERARPHPEGASSADDWSAFAWASRLAYADRDHYAGDDEFVPVPIREMTASGYLDQRARMIDVARAPAGAVIPGQPAGAALFERWGRDQSGDHPGTTHMSIVDGEGNAVSLTATVESVFGDQRMVAGFVLNNQLTDFSWIPSIGGRPLANAVAPRKRPRSSVAPTIITDRDGRLVMVVGSPGGSGIIAYVSRTIIGVLDWKQTPQAAIDTGNVVAANSTVRVESSRLPRGVAAALAARGWSVQEIASEQSGLQAILVTPQGYVGGADSRREGVARALP
ncbi:MAG TPA: gamma-glutamyltransferase [Caulobacterales bacterium]|nr:gamma-glutamyltransferase [Caulobacterales bacterium]